MFKLFITLFLLLLLTFGLLLVFRRGGPAQRLTRADAVRVLEDVLAGRASDAQWLVFMGLPVRHDPVLVEVRLRCLEIERLHYVGAGTHRAPALFRPEGLREIGRLLRWLQRETPDRLL